MKNPCNVKILYSVLMALSLVLFAYAYMCPQKTSDIPYSSHAVEKLLEKRCALLDSYAQKALEVPAENVFTFSDMPSDLVIYRYDNSHLTA